MFDSEAAVDAASPSPTLSDRIVARWRRDLAFFSIAATIIFFDQLTKWLVRSNLMIGEVWPANSDAFLRIIHVTNSGAAFGILQGQTQFLILTGVLGMGAILLYYAYPPMEHGLIRVALGLQLGGALGNFIDRVRLGHVTDFVDVGDFPTFNVADSAITISIVAVLTFFVLHETAGAGKEDEPPDAGSPPEVHD